MQELRRSLHSDGVFSEHSFSDEVADEFSRLVLEQRIGSSFLQLRAVIEPLAERRTNSESRTCRIFPRDKSRPARGSGGRMALTRTRENVVRSFAGRMCDIVEGRVFLPGRRLKTRNFQQSENIGLTLDQAADDEVNAIIGHVDFSGLKRESANRDIGYTQRNKTLSRAQEQ